MSARRDEEAAVIVCDPPSEIEMPLTVREELAKLAFEMTPAFVREAKPIAPERVKFEPCEAVNEKAWREEEAVVEVALKLGAATNFPDSIPPEYVEVAVEVAIT